VEEIIDLGGDVSTARGAEMMLPMWVRLMGRAHDAYFQLQDRPVIQLRAIFCRSCRNKDCQGSASRRWGISLPDSTAVAPLVSSYPC